MIVICFKLLQHPLRNSWGALSWYRPSQDVADAICTRCAWATETDKKTMQVAQGLGILVCSRLEESVRIFNN